MEAIEVVKRPALEGRIGAFGRDSRADGEFLYQRAEGKQLGRVADFGRNLAVIGCALFGPRRFGLDEAVLDVL